MSLRVATLNVWGLPPPLSWPPRHLRFPRVKRFLDDNAFDVVALQELWRPAPWGFDASSTWGKLIVPAGDGGADFNSGLAFAVLPALLPPEARGHGHHPYDAGAPFIERLWTRKGFMQVDAGGAAFITTHLQAYDTKKDALIRARQVDILLAHVAEIKSAVVVLGDFNLHDDNADDVATARRIIDAGFTDVVAPFDASPTWAMFGMSHRYDRIYARGMRALSARVLRSARLSDHLPVCAELELA